MKNRTEKHSLKQRGEDAATAYLNRSGFCVVERNWHCDAGVIDIVALDGDTIVLVDVKTRKSTCPGESRKVSATTATSYSRRNMAAQSTRAASEPQSVPPMPSRDRVQLPPVPASHLDLSEPAHVLG